MTPQESTMLQDLIRKVQETRLTEKDPEAEQLLLGELGRDPDAIYKLAQTVLVQNLAIEQAHVQMQQLQQQQQLPQPARATSFLGSLLGHRAPAPAAPGVPAQPQYQPVPYQQAPVYEAPPQYAPYAAPAPSAGGSFLRSAATTAAGVAAGALAFEGVESLLHGGFGHGGGGFGGYGPGFGGGAPEETIINNYYDEPRHEGGGFGEHREHEASFDERPEGHSELHDASYEPDTDPTTFDDAQLDDSGSDFGGGDDSNFS